METSMLKRLEASEIRFAEVDKELNKFLKTKPTFCV